MKATNLFKGALVFFCFCAYTMYGQKTDAVNNKPLWYSIINQKLSNDGNWSYFVKRFEDETREGVLFNNKTKESWQIPASDIIILENDFFYYKLTSEKLAVFNLKTHEISQYDNVKSFYKFSNSPLWIWNTNGDINLIKNGKKDILKIESDVINVQAIEDGKFLMLGNRNQTFFLDVKTGKKRLSLDSPNSSILAENHNFNLMTSRFLTKEQGKYTVQEFRWDRGLLLKKDITALCEGYTNFDFGESQVVIATKPKISLKDDDQPVVMEISDKGLKPLLDQTKSYALDAIFINYSNDTYIANPSQDDVSTRFLFFNDQYLLNVDMLGNNTSTRETITPSISIVNTKTGKKEFFIQATSYYFPISQLGLLLYFNNKDWYLYNVKTKENRNITETVSEDFYQFNRLNTSYTLPISSVFFQNNYSSVLITSKNNIWQLDLTTLKFTNRTKNLNPDLSFSILNKSQSKVKLLKWSENKVISDNIILLRINTSNELAEALAVLSNKEFKEIESLGNFHFDQVVLSDKFISYTKESYNLPYQLVLRNFKEPKSTTVFNSNESNQLVLPKAKLWEWQNNENQKEMQTIVTPPDYDANKVYPAIVRIYENEAKQIKYFNYPSYYVSTGFSSSLLAKNGYIIIYPAIRYKENKIGESALTSVLEAINFAKKHYNIGKLGIIGHSFGGYETNLLITKTSIFDAAISGSSVSNIVSSYFEMSKKYFRPNIWRFIDQGSRFSAGFYDLKEDYFSNSPILHADKITTPLLIWTGKEDHHVEWEQSLSFFNALKSINKPSKLILFPKERHTLENPIHQKQATEYFLNWFNLYLKN